LSKKKDISADETAILDLFIRVLKYNGCFK